MGLLNRDPTRVCLANIRAATPSSGAANIANLWAATPSTANASLAAPLDKPPQHGLGHLLGQNFLLLSPTRHCVN